MRLSYTSERVKYAPKIRRHNQGQLALQLLQTTVNFPRHIRRPSISQSPPPHNRLPSFNERPPISGPASHHSHSHSHSHSQSVEHGRAHSYEVDLQDEPTTVLHNVRYDIMALWRDPTVKEVLKKKKIRLEEQPGL